MNTLSVYQYHSSEACWRRQTSNDWQWQYNKVSYYRCCSRCTAIHWGMIQHSCFFLNIHQKMKEKQISSMTFFLITQKCKHYIIHSMNILWSTLNARLQTIHTIVLWTLPTLSVLINISFAFLSKWSCQQNHIRLIH